MSKTFTWILIVFVGAFLQQCSTSNLPDYNKLGDLRVLGFQLDKPEVNAGDTVTLTPIVSDLNGGGRTLTYLVQGCVDPGISIGAPAACPGTPDALGSGTISASSIAGNNLVYTGAATAVTFTTPASSVIFSQVSAVDQFNGISYLVFYTLSAPGANSVVAFKRVKVSTNPVKNTNPPLPDILSNGVALGAVASLPSSLITLSADLSATTLAKTYQQEQPDGSFETQSAVFTTTWFYSDGSMQYFRTNATDGNQWTPPASQPTGRNAVILAVTRDGIGGESFVKVEF